ncbi:unnamed protein product [Aphanomyces euteiches]
MLLLCACVVQAAANPTVAVSPASAGGAVTSGPISDKDQAVKQAMKLPFMTTDYQLSNAVLTQSGTGDPAWSMQFTRLNPAGSSGSSVSVDIRLSAKVGVVLSLSVTEYFSQNNKGNAESGKDNGSVDYNKAILIAKAFIDQRPLGIEASWMLDLSRESEYSTRSEDQTQRKVRFVRSVNGLPYNQELFTVYVDGFSGAVTSYQMYWTSVQFADPSTAVPLETAEAIYLDQTAPLLHFLDASNPNTVPRLVYTLRGQSVDAVTGELLVNQDDTRQPPNPLKIVSGKQLEPLILNLDLSSSQALERIKQVLNLTGTFKSTWWGGQSGRFDLVIPTKDLGRNRFDTVNFNMHTGQMQYYSSADGTDYIWLTKPKISESQARQTAYAFLRKAMPAFVDKLAETNVELEISDANGSTQPRYQFHFIRIADGIPVDNNDVDLVINAYNGTVSSLGSNLEDKIYPDQAVPVVSAEAAKRLLLSLYDVQLQYGGSRAGKVGLFYGLVLKPDIPMFYTGQAPELDAYSGEWRYFIGSLVDVPLKDGGWVDVLSAAPARIDYTAAVVLNGQSLDLDNEPVIRNGRTLVPFRELLKKLNVDNIEWDAASKRVLATKGNTRLELTIGGGMALVNGKAVKLDVPAQLIANRTYIPARFVAEALDAKVDWNAASRLILIRTDFSQTTDTPSAVSAAPTAVQIGQWRQEAEKAWAAKHLQSLELADLLGMLNRFYAAYVQNDLSQAASMTSDHNAQALEKFRANDADIQQYDIAEIKRIDSSHAEAQIELYTLQNNGASAAYVVDIVHLTDTASGWLITGFDSTSKVAPLS